MSEKLQQAISSIKAGNKQLGQQLLSQILQEEPNNEPAWLWMSAVVDEDKRKYCIERVLKINPNNQVARQALEKLEKTEGEQAQTILQASSQQHIQDQKPIIQDHQLQKSDAKGEKPLALTAKTVLRDAITIGIIGGILEIPALIAIMFIVLRGDTRYILLFLILNSTGIATGIRLFRKGIDSYLPISLGGAISGFVSSTILYLTIVIGSILILHDSQGFPLSSYPLVDGLIYPAIIGMMNAVTVWIPRIFINPNDPTEPFSAKKFINYFNPDRQKQDSPTIDLPVIREIPQSIKGRQKYWVNSSNSNIFFLLEDVLISGKINPKSSILFQSTVDEGKAPVELLKNKAEIIYSNITAVTKVRSVVTIKHTNNKREETLDLDCDNELVANMILDAVHEKLGAKFEKSSTPASIRDAIAVPGILLFITITLSTILYFILSRITVNQVAAVIGKEYLDQIIDVLRFFLYGGIFTISGLLLIAIIGVMINRIITLPELTKLTIKENSSDKLQRAIKYIKSGDIQQGHSLLTQIVKIEPNNEEAWFWTSAVVSDNNKQPYLERVLQINPNHQRALESLEGLKARKQAETIHPKTDLIKASLAKAKSPASVLQKFWINPTRKETFTLLLFENSLLTAKSEPSLTQKLIAQLSTGNIPYDLLTERITVSFESLIKIEERSNSLKINFQDKNGRYETIRTKCKDEKMSSEILSAIEQNTGTTFESTTAPISRGKVILENSVMLAIISGLSIFFYWAALEIEKVATIEAASARVRGIAALLDLLGPGGVACIGGGLFLLVFFSMMSSLLKPPLVTSLARKEPVQLNKSLMSRLQESEIQDGGIIQVNTQSPEYTYSSLLSAALSDGLLTGLLGGILSAIMPILFMVLKTQTVFIISLAINAIIILSAGIATGILYNQRKLPRGSKAVNIGGGLSGFITGGLCGITYGFTLNQNEMVVVFLVLFFCSPALISSLLAALTAGIPGLFIKPDPNLKRYDWRDGKSEVEVARIENLQKKRKKQFTTRLIIGGIMIFIILISSLCQSLAG